MPQIRVKTARTLNARVSLALVLSIEENEKLTTAYPNVTRSVAMNALAKSLLDQWFATAAKKAK